MSDIAFTLDSLRAAFDAGRTPLDVIEIALARIEEANDPGIFIHLESPQALRAAAAAIGQRNAGKPLWGVPFAVKDNIDVAGMPTTCACPAFAYVPDTDAPVVRALEQAGAICVGKTNLDQFASGLVGVRTPYPVPRNAVDERLVPGGSSSGSAVAVKRGIVAFSLGTDTAGSGRVPAALNGIVGLKPSLGALSTRGLVPACRTLDCISIFARSIADAEAVFSVTAAFDAADPFSRAYDFAGSRAAIGTSRIGIPSAASIRFFGDEVQAEAFAETVSQLRALGASVREVDFTPFYAAADLLYQGPWLAERLAGIAGFVDEHEDALHPVTRQIIMGAKGMTAVDAFNGQYMLQALKRQAEQALAGIDLLCVPSIPGICTLADIEADPFGPNARLGTYTNFVNLLDMCGLTLPTGLRRDGLPASITLLGRGGSDRRLASIGRELTGDGHGKRIEGVQAGAPATAPIRLAVVGAHLSGMVLNHELQMLGAKLVSKAATAAEYRLYVLPGSVPPKPGLLRVGPEKGASIALEIWSFPAEGFARFVSAIPTPLGVGTIRLDDGSSVQGFLVEALAVSDAPDITHFGGWRGYIASTTAEAPAANELK
ncbi:MAG: allophanate hydrolase [Rhodobiaceae bacterium]|nr:allophanate hydrolase [Rhodobiaceae bacterium]